MKTNKGKPGGRLGEAKVTSRRAFSKKRRGNSEAAAGAPRSKRQAQIHPAGQGGRNQQAGGPDHDGLDAGEDRNP